MPRPETPAWVDVKGPGGLWVDIVPVGTSHCLGDLDCWCKPTFEIVDSRESPNQKIIIVKHNHPPHSFVSGDMKRDAMDVGNIVPLGDGVAIEDLGEEMDDIYEDPDRMICEVCGATEGDTGLCEGPTEILTTYIEPEEHGDTDPCDSSP